MKNQIMIACFVLAGIVGIGTVSSTAAFARGNWSTVVSCQHGGFLSQLGTDGNADTTFGNTGGCVSFASHGGVLVALAAAAPCLNGGYAGLTSAGGTQAFASEAACVLYVGLGGTPVPFVSTPTLADSIVGKSSSVPGACALAVSGSGLTPGTHIAVNPSIGGSYTLVLVDMVTPVVVAADGTVNVTTYVFPGFTLTLSGTPAGGGTITSSSVDSTC